MTKVSKDISNNAPGRPPDRHKDVAILDAARDILFQQGLQAVSMAAVAARARVSKATVYSRHANKIELIRAVVRRQGADIIVHFAVAPGSASDLRASLDEFVRELLAFLSSDEHALLVRAVGAARAVAPDMAREIYLNGPQNTLDQLAGWLSSAAAVRLLHCPQPERSAELLISMLAGIDLVRTLFGVPGTRRGEALAAHADFVVDAFLRLHAVS